MTLFSILLIGLVALIFLSMAMAPLETLGWYAGWFRKSGPLPDPATPYTFDLGQKTRSLPAIHLAEDSGEAAMHYLVYLSGIGAIAGNSVPQEEEPFIAGLKEVLPATKVVSDVFPNSVTNLGLTGERVTAGIWRRIEKMRLKNPDAAVAFLVNGRNLIQMSISADTRYGPIYNLGVARELLAGLLRHGYPLGSGAPVTLVSWSGGAQIAVGAAWYLPSMIRAPVRVISIGGVLSSDRGLDRIQHLWHLAGSADHLSPLAKILYPGRWPIYRRSAWNRARAAGKITLIPLGPMRHNGRGDYFDNKMTLPNGETYLQHLLAVIRQVLTEAELEPSRSPAGSSPRPQDT
jgi:hypothetical protein